MAKKGKKQDNNFSKPTINDLFGAFQYYIDYDKDGYYVLAEKSKGKKEKVIAMGQSPSQLLTHAYIELNLKSIIYVSDVISYIIDCEQNQAISELANQLTSSLEQILTKVNSKKKPGSSENVDGGQNGKNL
jgi:hypothetical protein